MNMTNLRHALRACLREPLFTAAVVLVMAISIGANTAMFSIVHAVLIRPLPFDRADRLVWISELKKADRGPLPVSRATLSDWQGAQVTLDSLAAYAPSTMELTARGVPLTISVGLVSWNFFSTLKVIPIAGRDLRPEAERTGAQPVVIVGEQFWRSHLSGDHSVIGDALRIDQKLFTIVGIAPAALTNVFGVDAVVPLAMRPAATNEQFDRGMRFLFVIGRLREGVSAADAERDLTRIQRLIASRESNHSGFESHVINLQEHFVGSYSWSLLVLSGALGVVLLVCCMNVASMLVARLSRRAPELAMRAALGASGARLMGQLLIESVVLALLGGAAGILFARLLLDVGTSLIPFRLGSLDELTLHAPVLLFAVGLALVSGILFGVLPALQVVRSDVSPLIRGAVTTSGSRGSSRLRALLIIGELALTVTLLVGAGLMIRSFIGLIRTDPGFQAEGVTAVSFSLPRTRYPETQDQIRFARDLVDRLATLPRMRAVGITTSLPMNSQSKLSPVLIGDQVKPLPGRTVEQASVTPGYFPSLGIRLIRGRGFTDRDSGLSPPVAIVSESFVRSYMPDENPIGKRVRTFFGARQAREIIGIVADVHHDGLTRRPPAQLYVPFWQEPAPSMIVTAAATTSTDKVVSLVAKVLREADPELPVQRSATLESLLTASVAQPRFHALLLGSFSALTLLVASVGLYAVVAYSSAQRGREMAIRMALGADPSAVVRSVVLGGFRLAVVGVTIGVLSSLLFSRVLRSFLYNVEQTDVITYLGVIGIVLSVATFASYIPARHVGDLDPGRVLRD